MSSAEGSESKVLWALYKKLRAGGVCNITA